MQHYALVSLVAVAAVYLTNLSLHIVPYTIKIVFKSCRVLPVMMLSVPLQSRQYTARQYASAVAMVAGVLLFFASDWVQIERHSSNWRGITLLMVALALDALVANLEEQHFFRRSQPASRVEVLSYMSAFASLYAFVALAATGALLLGAAANLSLLDFTVQCSAVLATVRWSMFSLVVRRADRWPHAGQTLC